MSDLAPSIRGTDEEGIVSRVIGRAGDGRGPRGPRSSTLICIAGLHGNEPAGVYGLVRIFKILERESIKLHGTIIGLAGNLSALAVRRRFIDADLNRIWTRGRVAELDAIDARSLNTEAREQKELLTELRGIVDRASQSIFVLDLHTTSGEGAPFAVLNDTLPNRKFAMAFPVTLVLGIAENLGETLMDFMNDLGYVNVGFEAGQHDDPESVDNAEAATWIAMAAAGIVDSSLLHVREARRRLAAARGSLPRVVEARYRHAIQNGDRFTMEPGFQNFQPITLGQLMARDRTGEIRSKRSGRILMPLYQELGEDGFFIIHEFRPFWLTLSAWFRRLRFDAFIHWLPGVQRHPELPATYLIDRRIARWRSLDLLHLLGFRKQRAVGNVLVVSRRTSRSRSRRCGTGNARRGEL